MRYNNVLPILLLLMTCDGDRINITDIDIPVRCASSEDASHWDGLLGVQVQRGARRVAEHRTDGGCEWTVSGFMAEPT